MLAVAWLDVGVGIAGALAGATLCGGDVLGKNRDAKFFLKSPFITIE